MRRSRFDDDHRCPRPSTSRTGSNSRTSRTSGRWLVRGSLSCVDGYRWRMSYLRAIERGDEVGTRRFRRRSAFGCRIVLRFAIVVHGRTRASPRAREPGRLSGPRLPVPRRARPRGSAFSGDAGGLRGSVG
eukprot:5834465-Prymnesium_polylepis.1